MVRRKGNGWCDDRFSRKRILLGGESVAHKRRRGTGGREKQETNQKVTSGRAEEEGVPEKNVGKN